MSKRSSIVVLAAACLALAACVDADLGSAGLAVGPAGPHRSPAPRVGSSDWRRSWGLEVVDAYPAYAAGATGRGVTIALIDVGLDNARPGVAANLSPRSTDLIADRDPQFAASRHGDEVAGPLASALGGGGIIGVAYEATILSIRAELDGRCIRDECRLRAEDLARGIDYALDNGARVITLAVEGQSRLGPAFEAALARAVERGAVVVAAAGNEAAGEPAWPARYAADPRFAGSVLAVGAVTPAARIAPWSNRAGSTAKDFLVAPGQNVVTDCDTRFCTLVSGTSFAVPYVAGAVALVMHAHPELSGRQAGELVLRGARDLGARGADPVYGRGLVDIGRSLRLAKSDVRGKL